MTQNVYDDPGFFAGYSQLPRSVRGLEGAPEWPDLRSLLPPLAGLRVLDLGCGFGWFSRWAAEQGAAEVLGLDVSDRMLERARNMTRAKAVTYQQANLDRVTLPAATFDLCFSSLVLHYIEDCPRLLSELHKALKPSGRLVVSVEHPIYTASLRPGWMTTAEGERSWPVDHYQQEGQRVTDWLSARVVKQHRTIGTYVGTLIRTGFMLRGLVEWGPSDQQIEQNADLVEERDRPMFLLLAAAVADSA